MPYSRKTIIKQYEDASWPGTDCVLVEESGYLDLFVSADDGHTYKVHRVRSVEESDGKAKLFYALLDRYTCHDCGGCKCNLGSCLVTIDSKCSCK